MEKNKFVEIVYINEENNIIHKKISYRDDLTIKVALESLGSNNFSIPDIEKKVVGLFGHITNDFETKLKPFDRIEIYDKFDDSPNERRKRIFKKRNI